MEKICKNCGEKNSETAKFCKKCGSELDIHPNIVKAASSAQDDKSKKIILVLIVIAAILAISIGVYASGIMNHNDSTSENQNTGNSQQTTESDSVKTAQPSSSSAPASSQSMSILGGSFSTGSGLSDKTYAKIFVGPSHSGEQVTVQIWYSRDGITLNHGNMVPAHVDSGGYISISSADAYSKYPDYATINLYDSSGSKLLDTVSVSLAPTSGTQTF